MPKIRPFKAIRFAERLSPEEVAAPPYDVIDSEQRVRLAAKSDHNIVHVTLPREDYEGAGRLWSSWLDEGVVFEETGESIFLYLAGTSAGVICALDLEPFGEGSVLPHERTMPGPKADRLELMRRTEANLEPLWLFGASPFQGWDIFVEKTLGTEPLASVADARGTNHQLFRVPGAFAEYVAETVESVPLVMADGHHRYETAITHRDWMRSERGPGPWDATLALISDQDSFSPSLEAIHRVVSGITRKELARSVELTPSSGDVPLLASSLTAGRVGWASREGRFTFETSSPLDTTRVAELIEDLGAEVRYEHDLSRAEEALVEGSTVFLLAPVSMRTVSEMAVRGERMPPKTTLFGPKPMSGLVMRGLKSGETGLR